MKNKPTTVYEAIGNRIAYFRKEWKMTQKELAKKIGSTQQLIAAFENGSRRVPIQTLLQIAKEFHVEINDLLPMESEDKPRGPVPKVYRGFELLKLLPPKKQTIVLELIDSLSESNNSSKT